MGGVRKCADGGIELESIGHKRKEGSMGYTALVRTETRNTNQSMEGKDRKVREG